MMEASELSSSVGARCVPGTFDLIVLLLCYLISSRRHAQVTNFAACILQINGLLFRITKPDMDIILSCFFR